MVPTESELRLPVRQEADIVAARQSGRKMAATLGFSDIDLTLIATAISEIARNMIQYGKGGDFELALVSDGPRRGLRVTATDQGPGIADIEKAMQDGFSSGSGLGLGLPGARRLMDDFKIDSAPGKGTTIVMTKWKGR